jgi:two-component system chemotaxis response regulator CheY
MRFLVVDDSKIARIKLKEQITEMGYEVAGEACDGVEGVEKFKELMPDIVTTDLEMPNMKGDEMAKEILKINPAVKIILVTSVVDKKETLKALTIGVAKVIAKPFDPGQFKDSVKEIIERM